MQAFQFFHKLWGQTISLFFVILIFSGCSDIQKKKELTLLENGKKIPTGIKMLYPQNGTIFPPEIPAPLFEWKDSISRSSGWNIFISDSNGKVLIASECNLNTWRPDSLEWEKLKKLPDHTKYTFTTIGGKTGNKPSPSCRIQFSISNDSVGADIFYRAVTLPFSYAVKNVNTIEWYLGSVKGSKPRKMLDNIPVCGNCHSFSAKQPLLAMDIDYGNDKGSYVISKTMDTCHLKPENIITWSDYKREDNEPTFGLLSQISPDGNHVLSTVKDLSVFVAVDNNLAYSQLFFPIKGIIGIYDRITNSFDALNGANDPKYVQSNPSWSPDGKKIIFVRTEAYVNEKVKNAGRALLTLNDVNEFSSGEKQFKFDLYSVDFNDGKGGVAKPVEGASQNGKSNYFPKFSPDGKWVVFCQADNFMLLQRESRLYIMPSGGGKPRLMNCNMEEMNSWHSWSPNSRWIVFSSKNRGLYTQLYLTHIDENGIDSPPVLLENLCFDKRAANIPEFYPFNGDHFMKIKDDFSHTPQYFNRAAFDAMSNKYYKRALENLNRAFSIDSNYLETYFNLITLNTVLKQPYSKDNIAINKKAMKIVLDSLSQKPGDENYLCLKITLLLNMKKEAEALKEINLAIQRFPDSYRLYFLQSSVYKKQNQFENLIQCYKKMIQINSRKKASLNNSIAGVYMQMNKFDESLQILNQLIKEHPGDNNNLLLSRAQIMMSKKNFDLAKRDIDYIISKDSNNYKYIQTLAQYYLNQGNKPLSNVYNNQAIKLLNKECDANNEDADAIFELASLYMNLHDFQQAEEKYNLILNNFPSNYEALKQKAKIKLTMQLWNDAISIYDQLENSYYPEEEFYNNKAIAYIQIGNYPMALEYFNKTIELNPNNKDAIFNRGKLKSEMSNRR
jgi:tetratricopeptide (TPR) repeat protein